MRTSTALPPTSVPANASTPIDSRASGWIDDDRVEVGKPVERELGEVDPVGVAVERAVDVGPGVGAERDHADLELRSRRVDRAAALTGQVVAHDRRGEPWVGGHPVLDRVTQIDPGPPVVRSHHKRLSLASQGPIVVVSDASRALEGVLSRTMTARRALVIGLSLCAVVGVALLGAKVAEVGPFAEDERATLKVMTFNIFYGGDDYDLVKDDWCATSNGCPATFDKVVEAIRSSGADVVGLEEGERNTRQVADKLGWYASPRTQIVSRYPILDPADSEGAYVLVEVEPGKVVAVSSIHLPSDPYGPYAIRDGASAEKVLALEEKTRVPALSARLDSARTARRGRHAGVPRRRLQLAVAARLDGRGGRGARRGSLPGGLAGRCPRGRAGASGTPTARRIPIRSRSRGSPGRRAVPRP